MSGYDNYDRRERRFLQRWDKVVAVVAVVAVVGLGVILGAAVYVCRNTKYRTEYMVWTELDDIQARLARLEDRK